MLKIQPKGNVKQPWKHTSLFLGSDVQFFQNHYVPMKTPKDVMEKLTDLKKVMQQTKFHARSLFQVEVPVHPLLLNITNTYTWVRICTNTIERVRPYHKTIAVIFSSRVLKIQDDQRSHIHDIGHKVHKMRDAQIVYQDGLLQDGAM